METRTNLDKWLYLVRRIEEHREEKAVKELQKLYKKLIKDLRGKMGNLYADYADPETGRLTYEALHKQGLDARLLEEVAANVASVTADESRIIRETVEQTYANCYSGMVQAVQNAVDNEELHEVFAVVEAVKPEVIKAAVNNPVHGLTLSDQLEKNRADIIWGIKQAVGVGLSEGDRYPTMARRIQKELIGPDGAGGSYYKAVRIARTEAHRVREEGNLDAAQNLTEQLEPAGITMMKTWHTMKDERVRPSRSRKTKDGWKYYKSGKYDHQKMEGVQVPIKDDFTLPSGAKAQAPGKSGVAGEDINCRCFLSYDVVKSVQQLQKQTLPESKSASEEKVDYMSAVNGDLSDLPDAVRKKIEEGPKPGPVISKKQLEEFTGELTRRGYRFVDKVPGLKKATHGGFEEYRGSTSVLYAMLDELDRSKEYWPSEMKRKGILIGYFDFGNIEDFGRTQGRSICFNKRVFDDSSFLGASYYEASYHNTFAKKTNWRSVFWHEIGHAIQNVNPVLTRRTERIVRGLAQSEKLSFDAKALKLTSVYGINKMKDEYPELLSELLSAARSSDKVIREDALQVIKEVFPK